MMDEILSDEATLPKAIESYCVSESSESDRVTGLNTVLLQLHRKHIDGGLNELVAGHLKPYLTSEEGYVRMRGTQLLATLLQRLPEMTLNGQTLAALVKFFLDRFRGDYDSAGPCLLALLALLELHETAFDPDMVRPVCNSILGDHHVPAMTQSLRNSVYHIMKTLLEHEKFSAALRKEYEGYQLVSLYADAMEGEKDPRCLLVCLKVASLLLQDNCLVFESEDSQIMAVRKIFQVTSVYFPIVFRPPANDPYNIRAEDLWDALHSVFTSNVFMADAVFGMMIDKLNLTSSDVALAKVDSLKTLQICLPAYGCGVLQPCADSFREILIRLVINAEQAQIADEAITTVGVIAGMLAKQEEVLQTLNKDPSDSWRDFVEALVDDCTTSVGQSVDSMVGRASAKLLACVAKSSAMGFSLVLRRVLHIISEWCNRPDVSVTQRSATCELLISLIECINPEVDFPPEHNPLKRSQVDMIFSLFVDEISKEPMELNADGDDETSGVSIVHPSNRPRTSSIVASAPKRLAVKGLQLLVLRPPSPLLTKDQVSTTIKHWADILVDNTLLDKDEVHSSCVEALVAAGNRSEDHAQEILEITIPLVEQSANLDVLADLCAIPKVFDSIMPHMLDTRRQQDNQQHICGVIAKILKANKQYEEGLTKCCLPLTETDGDADNMVLLQRVAYELSQQNDLGPFSIEILRTISQNVAENVQVQLVNYAVTVLLPGDELMLPAVTAIVGSALPSVVLQIPALENVIETVLSISLQRTSSKTLIAAPQLLASMLGKCENDPIIERVVNKLIKGCDKGNVKRAVAFETLSLVGKVLAMRAHPLSRTISEFVMNLLSDDDVQFARIAAGYFGVVIAPCNEVLNRECYTKESLFFKQKFFGSNFTTLMEHSTDDAHLLAALQLLEGVPKGLLLQDVESILPFVTKSLAQDDMDIKTSALASLHVIALNSLQSMDTLITTLVPLLLDLTIYKKNLLAKHRALAIDMLLAISDFPYNKLHTVKNQVIRTLAKAVDDPKRPIRKKAVICRNKWLMLTNI